MRERDRVSSLFWLIVGACICVGALKLSLGKIYKPGPGFFPFLAGAILIILSSFVLLQSFKGFLTQKEHDRGYQALWSSPQGGLKMICVLTALICYAIGLKFLGFVISTLIFLGFLLKYIGSQRWSVVLSVSFFGAVLSYIIFEYWLGVPFPKGIFGF
ncbi:tripartite tricarboxylate transporter TctB family protein [Thermodesulfobacteriota bacterium]